MDPELMAILETDALQPVKSILLLALEQCESDDLFQQLLSVDSALETLMEPMKKLADELDFRYPTQQLTDMEKVVEKFEKIQRTVRDKFNLRAQVLLRDVRARSFPDEFPDEVLLNIVSCFESNVDESNVCLDDGYPVPCTESRAYKMRAIQNIRLTCRRLCDVSSHLLVPCIRVSPSLSSLEHLNQVASHPLISQGLRIFWVNMAVLNTTSATDFRHFSRDCYDRLGRIIQDYERYPVSGRKAAFLKIAENVYNTLRPFMPPSPFATPRSELDPENLDSLDLPQRSLALLLLQEHTRIGELYLQQMEILRSGRLLRAIAAAAARSRSNVCLRISDSRTDPDESDPFCTEEAQCAGSLLDVDFDFVIRSTRMHAGNSWHTADVYQTPKSPYSILYELPLEICAAGATLTGFKIGITCPVGFPCRTLDITQEKISALGRVSKDLKAFTFTSNGCMERKDLFAYIHAITGPRKVPNLNLDLLCTQYGPWPPLNPYGIGPLLTPGTWDRLETLTLKYYRIHLNELERLLGALKPGVNIIFDSIMLLSGTWAEALDCIRSKAGPGSQMIFRRWQEEEYITPEDIEYYGCGRDDEATAYITMRPVEGVRNPFAPEE